MPSAAPARRDEVESGAQGSFTVQGGGGDGDVDEPGYWQQRAERAETLLDIALGAVEKAWDEGHLSAGNATNPYAKPQREVGEGDDEH